LSIIVKMLCRVANNSKYFLLKFLYNPEGRRPPKEFLYIFKIKKDNLLSYSDTVNVFIFHNFVKKENFFKYFLKYRINNLAETEKKKLVDHILKYIKKDKRLIKSIVEQIKDLGIFYELNKWIYRLDKDIYECWKKSGDSAVLSLMFDYLKSEDWHENYKQLLDTGHPLENDRNKIYASINLLKFIFAGIKCDKTEQFLNNILTHIRNGDNPSVLKLLSSLLVIFNEFINKKFIKFIFDYNMSTRGTSIDKKDLYFYQHIKPLMSKIKIMALNDIENFFSYPYNTYRKYRDCHITVYFRQGKMVLDDTIVFVNNGYYRLFEERLSDRTKNFFIYIFSDKIPKKLEEWKRKIKKNSREKKIRFIKYMGAEIQYVVEDYLTNLRMFRVEIGANGNTKKIEIYLTPYYEAFTKSLEFFEVEIEKEYFWVMMQHFLL